MTTQEIDRKVLYILELETKCGSWEGDSYDHTKALGYSTDKGKLISWYNENLDKVYIDHATAIPDGADTVRFSGNTGGGYHSVSCVITIRQEVLL